MIPVLVLALFAFLFIPSAGAQPSDGLVVKGKVSDAEGPLRGVTVKVTGSSASATTDADGNYSIKAGGKATLVFTYVGYQEQRIPVSNRSLINVTMVSDQKEMEAVVVTGYRAQTRGTITGSAWSAVAEIPAAGFAYAGPAYQYNDQQVSDGNYLYRIRMVARDGSVKYSAVQFVRVDSGTNFLIYPNPARSYTNIRSQSMQPETIQVSLAGQNGTVFWQRQGSVSKFAPLRLDLDGIPPGDYIIIIMTSSRRQSETLRILN